MTTLPPTASFATPLEDAKLFAPSADRNMMAIVELVSNFAPASGQALEIASGTGQHVVALAQALPKLNWQPTDVASERRESIDAYASDVQASNIAKAVHLDASAPDWSATHHPKDLIMLSNLLHLISEVAVQTLINEAAKALADDGTLILYGPFRRNGKLTSEGDARFDAELRNADPTIGYKDDMWMIKNLSNAGLNDLTFQNMPANNLALIARKDF